MRPELSVPPKLRPGDRVAIVSPSHAAPGAFTELHEQAMRRLRDDFGLEPVEYPTTRRLAAPAQERGRGPLAGRIPHDPAARRRGQGPGRGPDGRVRRPDDPGRAGHDRWRRPADGP